MHWPEGVTFNDLKLDLSGSGTSKFLKVPRNSRVEVGGDNGHNTL